MDVMKLAYGALGIAFVAIFAAAYFLLTREVEAPTTDPSLDDNQIVTMLTLESPAFKNGEAIPFTYTCDGANVSPELRIIDVPESARSLVLLMDDPDIPAAIKEQRGIEKFDHFVLYNIPPDTAVIEEGESVGMVGLNSRGDASYTGPCPPSEYEPKRHRYFFRLYALDTELSFDSAPTLDAAREAMEGHVIEEAELMGTYERAPIDSKG